MKKKQLFATIFVTVAIAVTAFAGEADITQVEVIRTGPGVYRFSVSVLHKDEGWDHYADRWELLAPDGRILSYKNPDDTGERREPIVVINWDDELDAKVPK